MRSAIAVLGGLLVFYVLYGMLETTLVRATAGAPINDIATYLAVRNRPMMAAAQFAIVPLAGVLAGYLTAKLATAHELAHGIAASVLVAGALIRNFMTADTTPHSIALRALLILSGAAALTTGAYIRGQARILGSQS
jgi:hypothetical protein